MSAEAGERMREMIESVRHTRAQLAAWGVPWPPPAGWKRRLIEDAARGEGLVGEVERLRTMLMATRDVLDLALGAAIETVEGNFCGATDEEGAPEPQCPCNVCDAHRLLLRAEKLDPTPAAIVEWRRRMVGEDVPDDLRRYLL